MEAVAPKIVYTELPMVAGLPPRSALRPDAMISILSTSRSSTVFARCVASPAAATAALAPAVRLHSVMATG
uniref:Uncharacterized protein n=1 Tax=Oryza sativa subsp. japonica TaxID=39947 RepID=Q6YUZ3_ORYSJ|nr:hypothetical protein [Oryza sativa Japonica Group]